MLGYWGSGAIRLRDEMNWERDDSRTARIASMHWRQQYQTAVMAICRLRKPLLEVDMPADWAVPPDLIGSMFETMLAEPTEALDHEVRGQADEVLQAPLFEFELEPEFVEEVQLEALNGLLMLGEGLRELGAKRADYIVYRVRAMTTYVDEVIADSLRLDPDEGTHRRYLSQLGNDVRAYGLGYFGSRNIELEFACHGAIVQSSDVDFFSSAAGRELLIRSNEYSAEVATALRRFLS
ncbi:hypothetical protein [Streptomyces sp. NPDC005209]|uniref:hypothetical protein n=1 Tax=Streptomyces sp. NPDC005209 TaxID=3156715 RepID=UPI0033A9DE26